MLEIPRDKNLDSTLALFLDPYEFISKRCRHYDSDIFETRLLLQKTICMTGPEAAELFYQPDRFVRQDATPGRIQKTLFGQGGVQGLDDEAHRHRKHMFMSLMTPESIDNLKELTAYWLQVYAGKHSIAITEDRLVSSVEHWLPPKRHRLEEAQLRMFVQHFNARN